MKTQSRNLMLNILRPAIIAMALIALSMVSSTNAQTIVIANGDEKPIDAKTQAAIIDSVSKALNDEYIFLDKAQEMEKLIRSQYKKGAYKDIKVYPAFMRKLTEDLRSVSHDLHLGVAFVPDEQIREMQAHGDSTVEDSFVEEMKQTNWGFKKMEILDGNVGYLDLRGFAPAEMGGATAIAAMNFLSNCDAIIFDLRQNGGGEPSMIQLISSYLFENPTHLNSFYIRATDTIEQFWTQAYVPGKKVPNVDVYVLTSPMTFSGAEEFSYNLKNLKRGTIIGKTTGGGAHPVNGRLFADLNLMVRVPYGRAINPITGTNWEGVGVAPDVDVDAEKALDAAYMMALRTIADKSDNLRKKERLQWAAEVVNARVNPIELSQSQMQEYVGTYGPRRVWIEDGKLRYQRGDNPANTLIPLGNDRFKLITGVDYFRAQFLRGEDGRVTTFVGLYDNGESDRHERTQ